MIIDEKVKMVLPKTPQQIREHFYSMNDEELNKVKDGIRKRVKEMFIVLKEPEEFDVAEKVVQGEFLIECLRNTDDGMVAMATDSKHNPYGYEFVIKGFK